MKLTQEIVERFLQDISNDEENRTVEKWYFSFEKNSDGIGLMPNDEQLELENEIYLKIKRKIQPFEDIARPSQTWKYYLSGVAALLLFTLGVWFYDSQNTNQTTSDTQHIEWKKYDNSSSKEFSVVLPDGSMVLLKPNTQLSYNQEDTKLREVNLVGEAFFDVKKDVTRPFMIYTGKVTTKVLGTSFSIKAFPEMQKFEVSVTSGKVTVYEKDEADKKDNGDRKSVV